MTEEFNEEAHPDGLGDHEAAEEEDFAGDVGGAAESAEAFAFKNVALAGDFAGGVVGGHQGDEHDLHEDESGDEPSGIELALQMGAALLCLDDEVGVGALGEGAHLRDAFEAENDDEEGKAEQHGELQPELGAVAPEDSPATGEEFDGLGEEAGEFVGFVDFVAVVFALVVGFGFLGFDGRGRLRIFVVFNAGSLGFGEGNFAGFAIADDFWFVDGLESAGRGKFVGGVVGVAMAVPGIGPAFGAATGEFGIDVFGVFDAEIMGESAGRTVVDDAAFVQHEDGVVEGKVAEVVGNVDDDAVAVGAGEVVKELGDLTFGFGIESAGDFVAEKQGGLGDDFKGEAESAFLAAGEDFDLSVAQGGEAGAFEGLVEQGGRRFVVVLAGAQGDGAGDAFFDGEELVGDAELRNIAEFGGVKVAVFSKVATLPEDFAGVFLLEAGDGFHQGGFAAAGGSNDGEQVAGGDAEVDVFEEGLIFPVAEDAERDVVEF